MKLAGPEGSLALEHERWTLGSHADNNAEKTNLEHSLIQCQPFTEFDVDLVYSFFFWANFKNLPILSTYYLAGPVKGILYILSHKILAS